MKTKTNSEIVLYQTADGETRLEVQFQGETAWLTQKELAELFGVDRTVITKHLRNIFKESELAEDSVVKESLTTEVSGNSRSVKMFWMCRLTFCLVVWNNSAIWPCVNQTVSFSSRTSNCVRPSSVW